VPHWLGILINPAFLIAAVVIIGGSLVALRMSKRQLQAQADLVHPPEGPAHVRPADRDLRRRRRAGRGRRRAQGGQGLPHEPGPVQSAGGTAPRGMLLYGPPGSGKTLLARALAGETGVPFYSVSASSFVEVYVGIGAARVRQLFEEAKKNTPSIVFIDELDAVGRRRSADVGGDREFDHTLNQLLVELDGFAMSEGVVLIGATNRPELIDPALMRPGRFDRRMHVDKPDVNGRLAILSLHASRRPFSGRIDWMSVAHRTPGLTGAELANIVNEASFPRRPPPARDHQRRGGRGSGRPGGQRRQEQPGHQRRPEAPPRLPRGRPRHPVPAAAGHPAGGPCVHHRQDGRPGPVELVGERRQRGHDPPGADEPAHGAAGGAGRPRRTPSASRARGPRTTSSRRGTSPGAW